MRVLDPFHVVRLGFACVDDVRRRVQQDVLGHRGRRGDPLYGADGSAVNVALACADPGIDTSSLLDDYAGFLDTLARSEQAKHIRCRQAAVFMERAGDLDAWMRRTTIEPVPQIRRLEVWPFLSWCFATGHVVPDLELIAAKGKGAHFSLWAAMHPSDLDELRSAAASFGWTPI